MFFILGFQQFDLIPLFCFMCIECFDIWVNTWKSSQPLSLEIFPSHFFAIAFLDINYAYDRLLNFFTEIDQLFFLIFFFLFQVVIFFWPVFKYPYPVLYHMQSAFNLIDWYFISHNCFFSFFGLFLMVFMSLLKLSYLYIC